MPSTLPDSKALLAMAHDLADSAAAITLRHFRTSLAVENKGAENKDPVEYFDPVTLADRQAEECMRAMVAKVWPTHGFWGEEYGPQGAMLTPEGKIVKPSWIVDPIDGTRAYIMGIPLWASLIAFHDGTSPCVGLMDQPLVGDRFFAVGGKSFWRQGVNATPRRVHTRPCATLSHAVVATTHPAMFQTPQTKEAFDRLAHGVRMVRYGTDSYGYALLAAGYVDLVVEGGLQPYDVQALLPLVRNAGGVFTDWQGKDPQYGGCVVAAGSAALHEQALKVLQS